MRENIKSSASIKSSRTAEVRPSTCIYRGEVFHHRTYPRDYRFKMSLYMFGIDLERPEKIKNKILSFEKFNLFTFCATDYLKGFKTEFENNEKNNRRETSFDQVRERLLFCLSSKGVVLKQPRFYLLTQVRILGYLFNPVSFYYCYDGNLLHCVLAEVTNTFKERKVYLIPNSKKDSQINYSTKKNFYVSPFSPPNTEFEFVITPPQNKVRNCVIQKNKSSQQMELETEIEKEMERGKGSNIKNFENPKNPKNPYCFYSHFSGVKKKLTVFRLALYFFTLPLQTFKITFMIYFHAFLLWFKKFPYFKKDDFSESQTDFFSDSKKRMG